MSQIGKISKSGIDKILKWAEKGKKTGAFAFSRFAEKKFVYIKNGAIVTASSNNPKERLGQVMLRLGMITPQQIENIQEFQKKGKCKFGKAVLQLQFVNQKDLIAALHKQTEEITVNLFDWQDGEFLFYLNKRPPVEVGSFPLTMDDLIRNGRERRKSWNTLGGRLPSADNIIELSFDTSPGDQNQQFDEEEFKVMTLVDGLSTFHDICFQSELTDFDTARILIKFIENKCIHIKQIMDDSNEKDEGDKPVVGTPTDGSSGDNGDKLEELKQDLKIFLADGNYPEAKELLLDIINKPRMQPAESSLIETLQSEISALHNIPHIINGSNEDHIKKSIKDAQTGFILSRIDGKLNIKLLSNISGLPKEKVREIIFHLFKMDIISIEKNVPEKKVDPAAMVDKKEESSQPTSQDIVQLVNRKYQSMAKLDYYEIFEIEKSAQEADIKKAYHIMAKQFHPDMVRDVDDANIRKVAEIVFEKIQLAYDTLHDSEKKANYDQAKGFNLTEEEQRRLARLRTKAGLQYQIGMKAYKARNYKKAIEFIKSAIDINPEDSIYYGILAEIQSKNPKWFGQAKKNAIKAIELDFHNPLFYITLGMINLTEGQTEEAENNFQKALNYDPGNEAAITQLEKLGKVVKKKKVDPYDKIITKDIALR